MFEYTIRRFLLMIPTGLGITFMVFFILQIAPDGPFERAVKQLKEAQGAGSEGGSMPSSNVSSSQITPELLEQMRMQFGLDKPIIIRYLIWLGLHPKEKKNKTVSLNSPFRDSFESVNIGEYNKILLQKYIRVEEDKNGLHVIESGAGLEFTIPPDSILKKQYIMDDETTQSLALYRKHYRELPENPKYIKTWYESEWKIKNFDEVNNTVTISSIAYQGILTGYLGYSEKKTVFQNEHVYSGW